MRANGLRYLRWGGRRNAVRTETAGAKKLPEKRADSQRQVHAVLGGNDTNFSASAKN